MRGCNLRNLRHLRIFLLRRTGDVQMRHCVILAFSIFALGCGGSNTDLANVWVDPQYRPSPMSSMLVVALRKDPGRRRVWEDAFVQELQARGVRAVPSYQFYPGNPPEPDSLRAMLQRERFDGVLVARRGTSSTESRWVPGTAQMMPSGGYIDPYGRYSIFYQEVGSPGYVEAENMVQGETTVWDLRGGQGRTVWSAGTETKDPSSPAEFAREVSRAVMPAMAKAGIVPGGEQ